LHIELNVNQHVDQGTGSGQCCVIAQEKVVRKVVAKDNQTSGYAHHAHHIQPGTLLLEGIFPY